MEGFLWDADLVLRIRTGWDGEVFCRGCLPQDSDEIARCQKNEEDIDEIDRLLQTMSQSPPTAVIHDQLVLASLCLCSTHSDQQLFVARQFSTELQPIQNLCIPLPEKGHQLASLRTQLCQKLGIREDDFPDERILKTLQNTLWNSSIRRREIVTLKGNVSKSEENAEKATRRCTEHERESERLRSRVENLEQALKDSVSYSQHLESSLRESAENVRRLQTDLEKSKEDIHRLESERDELKSSMI